MCCKYLTPAYHEAPYCEMHPWKNSIKQTRKEERRGDVLNENVTLSRVMDDVKHLKMVDLPEEPSCPTEIEYSVPVPTGPRTSPEYAKACLNEYKLKKIRRRRKFCGLTPKDLQEMMTLQKMTVIGKVTRKRVQALVDAVYQGCDSAYESDLEVDVENGEECEEPYDCIFVIGDEFYFPGRDCIPRSSQEDMTLAELVAHIRSCLPTVPRAKAQFCSHCWSRIVDADFQGKHTVYTIGEDPLIRESDDSSSNDEDAVGWIQALISAVAGFLKEVSRVGAKVARSMIEKMVDFVSTTLNGCTEHLFGDIGDKEIVAHIVFGLMLSIMAAPTWIISIHNVIFACRLHKRHKLAAVALWFSTGLMVGIEQRVIWPSAQLHSGLFDVANVTKMIAVLAAVLVVKFLPGKPDLDALMTRADKLPKALKGLDSLSSYLSQAFTFVEQEISVACGGERNCDSALPQEVENHYAIIVEMSTKESMERMATDMDLCARVEIVYNNYLALRKAYHSYPIINRFLTNYAGLVYNLRNKALTHNPTRNSSRPKTVMTIFQGGSGVGKSELIHSMALSILAATGLITPDMTDEEIKKAKDAYMYARNKENVYWDGYSANHKITVVDDFAQKVDTLSNPNEEFFEVIRMCNRFPYPLHMAHLDDKANTYFASEHVLATTNLKTLKAVSIIENEALWSRVDFGFNVQVKEEFRTADGKINKLAVKNISTDVYEFRKWNPETGEIGEEVFSYDQMSLMVVERAKYFKEQHEQSSKSTTELARREMARLADLHGIVDIVRGAIYATRLFNRSLYDLATSAIIHETNKMRDDIQKKYEANRKPIAGFFQRWGTVCMCVAGATALFAMVYKKWYTRQAKLHSGRDLPKNVVKAKFEGVSSVQASETLEVVKHNFGFLNEKFPVWSPGGRQWLVNKHYWDILPDDLVLSFTKCSGKYELKKSEITVVDPEREKSDLLLLLMPRHVEMMRNLTFHMMTATDMATLSGKKIAMLVPHAGRTLTWNVSCGKVREVHTKDKLGSYRFDETGIKMLTTIESDVISNRGDCGGIYVVDDDAYQQKICGFHFAGTSDGVALSFPLVNEDFKKGAVVVEHGHVLALPVDSNLKGVRCRGVVREKASSASKTKIVPTPIFGEVQDTTVAPSKLGDLLAENGAGMKALAKLEGDVMYVSDDEVADAVISYKENLYQNTVPEEHRRKLTFDEAIVGISGEPFIRPINRTTSAGYPWTLESKAGKRKWLGSDEYTLGEPCDAVRKVVGEKDQGLKEKRWIPSLYTDTLKDETRPLEKVKAGKTRVFAAASMDLVILVRMYFLSFFSFIMKNRIRNEVAVGMMCQGPEWHMLATRMLKRGEGRMIAGDFSNYDGTLHPKILMAVCDIANDWYRDEWTDERVLLFEDIVHSWHVTGPYVTSWLKSQPSGNPGTAIFNSIYNSLATRIAYARAGGKDFNKHVTMVSYGDDNLICMDETVPFGQQALSDAFSTFGMTYTSETKGEVTDYRMLEEVSFLKRGFRFDKRCGVWMAPLERNSINERLNWHKSSKSEWEILRMNAEAAIFEWSLHEDEDFLYWSRRIEQAFRNHGKALTVNLLSRYRTIAREGTAKDVYPELTYA